MIIETILGFIDTLGIPYVFLGDAQDEFEGFSSLIRYKYGSITWIKRNESLPSGLDSSEIRLAVVSQDVVCSAQNIIKCNDSKRCFFSVLEHFFSAEEVDCPMVGNGTYLSAAVKIGNNVHIGHNCTLDGSITIGDNTRIGNNVVIVNHVTIGCCCDVQSGVIIGHDGFGYVEDVNKHKQMVRHYGGVYIGDNVLIGANSCICRGTIDDTYIGNGTKIDNLSHIAHNCVIGNDVGMAFPCYLGGSSKIGDRAYIAHSVIRNQITVEEDSFIGMSSNVLKDVKAGTVVCGNPAREMK